MTKAAFALAKEKGVAISFDPNIRRKLWRGQDCAPLIRELTLQSEIVLLGLDEADALFGLRDPDAIFDLLFRDGCAQYVAIKDGGNGAWVADKTTREKLPPYPCKPIEPIGREISREISENTERLKAQLTQAQFALMEPFLEQMTLSRSMELESRFCFGFAAGIRLQQKGNAFFSGRKQLW